MSLWREMSWRDKFMWGVVLPIRILVWPLIWFLLRKNAGSLTRPNYSIDNWLVGYGHVVRTHGYFFWEKKAKICWWCVALWLLPIIFGFGYVLQPYVGHYFQIGGGF